MKIESNLPICITVNSTIYKSFLSYSSRCVRHWAYATMVACGCMVVCGWYVLWSRCVGKICLLVVSWFVSRRLWIWCAPDLMFRGPVSLAVSGITSVTGWLLSITCLATSRKRNRFCVTWTSPSQSLPLVLLAPRRQLRKVLCLRVNPHHRVSQLSWRSVSDQLYRLPYLYKHATPFSALLSRCNGNRFLAPVLLLHDSWSVLFYNCHLTTLSPLSCFWFLMAVCSGSSGW